MSGPSVSRGLRALAVGFVLLGLGGVYLAGFPPAVANPIYAFAAAVLAGLASRRGRAWRAGLAFSFALTLALLVVGDLLLRTELAGRLHDMGADELRERIPAQPELSRYAPLRDVTIEVRGDLDRMRRNPRRPPRAKRIVTDALGYRNSPQALESPLDLVLLGDSFVAGSALSHEQTWAEQLRRDHGVRAYSLAVPSNPWEQLMMLKRHRDRIGLAPGGAVVWAIFPGNDFKGRYRALELPPDRGWLGRAAVRLDEFRDRSPLRILTERVLASWEQERAPIRLGHTAAGEEVLFLQSYLDAVHWSPEVLRERRPRSARVGEVLRAMQQFVEDRGWSLVVLLLPTKFEVYPEMLPDEAPARRPVAFAEWVLEACAEAGVELVDLGPVLRAAKRAPDPDELLFRPDDTHLSPRGAAVVSGRIARWWRQRAPAGAGARDPPPVSGSRSNGPTSPRGTQPP